jgi:uncharacterized protein
MERNKGLDGVAKTLWVLASIGAINWGLIGFFNWNLVEAIFGGNSNWAPSVLSRVIYALVGLCGLASLFFLPRLAAFKRGREAYRTTEATPRIGGRSEIRP